MLAGGLPLTFPTICIHESFAHPTSMYLRNLMAMDAEEMIRAQPMDAVVLIGGCDKTVPAQMMAAASADLPAIVAARRADARPASHKGERLGACTDCRRLWGRYRAGEIDAERDRRDQRAAGRLGRHLHGDGHGEHDGLPCRGARPDAARAGLGAGDRGRPDAARRGDRQQAVALAAAGGPRPSEILTRRAFRNALVVLQALGGSTNGIIHLAAIAGRLGRRSTSTSSTRSAATCRCWST